MRARSVQGAIVLSWSLAWVVRAADQVPPTFAAEVAAVYVDVFVTSRDRPVSGLTAGDFEITDEGVPQTATLAKTETVSVASLLLFDTSGSVTPARLTHLRAAGEAALKGLTKNDQAALVTFSQVVAQHAKLTSDLNVVRSALEFTATAGDTALVDGVYTAMMIGENASIRPVTISIGRIVSGKPEDSRPMPNCKMIAINIRRIAVTRIGNTTRIPARISSQAWPRISIQLVRIRPANPALGAPMAVAGKTIANRAPRKMLNTAVANIARPVARRRSG